MKKLFILNSAFLLSCFSNSTAQDTLTILHLNDTHSCLTPLGPRTNSLEGTHGGIARAATVGTYQVKFDASNLTSSVDFYQLKASNFSETRKMLLMKKRINPRGSNHQIF